MKKKFVAGAVTLLSVVALAACAKGGSDKDIVTMKGDTITVGDFYDEIKHNQGAQQYLFQMTINKVFEKEYGSKVSDKDVEKKVDEQKKQLGEAFNSYLTQQGLTEETNKQQIRSNLLLEYAVDQAISKELTDEAYKKAFESYTPEITANVIKLDSEEKANEVLASVKAEGADFAQIAKENSTDASTKEKGGEIKFDSGTTTVPTRVKEAASKLDVNGISDVVIDPASQKSAGAYYIVKVTKKEEKGSDWKKYEKRLKEILTAERKNDANFIRSIIAKAMTNANIKVKDDAFKATFNQYMQNIGATTEDSSSSK
ncbi:MULTISPECIES: peptidylprolyl isomerase [Streptococcus]|jgi:foldase protein prsA|uniref:peptidylprolyl isomerase n=1 Tax=Streptococcus TaxID=1301 RepID=UPI00065F86BF|nr:MULTISPECIES: peptidylprolyl isomerase [Streptococcus]MBS4898511.1 peptidyl-prolyl cis-trans isomerase [Streptococcus sp.]MDB8644349.1 peptidylprolyl isomerase [Streptococcus australis]MDB8649839.1 peptidylprolyl isomerase [Streptococcus australis]RJU50495.1 foldase PrsA [Streptococcus sp. AM28-20]RXV54790.1 foldase PrsA [Streptococcus australis]